MGEVRNQVAGSIPPPEPPITPGHDLLDEVKIEELGAAKE